ncbi:hypothetical protein HDU76_007865 [Blyttiomyces sp. JEL0837]|nr:hypothetical protein HDU76_007865 [Blyttiomyces sp. JEL0837]
MTVRVRILGVDLSDKVFLYILSAQLLWSSFPGSLIVGACGFLAGMLYKSETLPFRRWRLPETVNKFGENHILPWLASTPSYLQPTDRRRAAAASAANVAAGGGVAAAAGVRAGGVSAAGLQRRGPNAAAAAAGTSSTTAVPGSADGPVNEEAVATLVGLGFGRSEVVAALRAADNDVERAAASLLDSR